MKSLFTEILLPETACEFTFIEEYVKLLAFALILPYLLVYNEPSLQCILVGSNLPVICVCRIDMNFVIKVADFGLSVDVYSRNYFREKRDAEEEGETPAKFPIRWMALESLNDGIFNEKTDVVSSEGE